MGKLVRLQEIDQFCEVVSVPKEAITSEILDNVKILNEPNELEPMLRDILGDLTETPHGPTEIADILTTKILLRGNPTIAAFVLKGKSFKQVRSTDIAHQVLRLQRLPGLGLIALVAVGNIQDDARRDFFQVAKNIGCDYLIIDSVDCARLFLAYQKICPIDGTPYNSEGICRCGHGQDKTLELKIRIRDGLCHEITSLRDLSNRGVRRLSANVLVNSRYDRESLRVICKAVTEKVRITKPFYKNQAVKSNWRSTDAQVVWLYLTGSLQDLRNANWLGRTQWISQDLDKKNRPITLCPVSEVYDGIAIAWNESYDEMHKFYEEHSVDKAEALRALEPLIDKATELGIRIIDFFEAVERDDNEELALIGHINKEMAVIEALEKTAYNLPFPPEDIKDYDTQAQSLIAHLSNMAIYFSSRGVSTWPYINRVHLMRSEVEAFRRTLERLAFEREKLN